MADYMLPDKASHGLAADTKISLPLPPPGASEIFAKIDPGMHWTEYCLSGYRRTMFEKLLSESVPLNWKGVPLRIVQLVNWGQAFAEFAYDTSFLIKTGRSGVFYIFEYEGHGKEFLRRFGDRTLKYVYTNQEHIPETPAHIENPYLHKPVYGEIVSQSIEMQNVLELIDFAAKHDIWVLITGETGVGKELCARRLHEVSNRNRKPFVPVTCSAIPDTLIESELFGYEKGAFTGANRAKPGAFEEANEGTIFLDEIGDLTLPAQVKILRALQERKVRRLGGNKEIPINVRVITATNIDLETAVRERRFREDLYYRLNVLRVQIPPLRNRPADIPVLLNYFAHFYSDKMNMPVIAASSDTIAACVSHPWPGNVRQLENAVQQALVLAAKDKSNTIEPRHIIPAVDPKRMMPITEKNSPSGAGEVLEGTSPAPNVPQTVDLENITPKDFPHMTEASKKSWKDAEKFIIEWALTCYRWNKTKTAKKLGLSYKAVLDKIKEYGIEEADTRSSVMASATRKSPIIPLGIAHERGKEVEKAYIARALEATQGNRTRAARLLGISYRALLYKIREYQLVDVGATINKKG